MHVCPVLCCFVNPNGLCVVNQIVGVCGVLGLRLCLIALDGGLFLLNVYVICCVKHNVLLLYRHEKRAVCACVCLARCVLWLHADLCKGVWVTL